MSYGLTCFTIGLVFKNSVHFVTNLHNCKVLFKKIKNLY